MPWNGLVVRRKLASEFVEDFQVELRIHRGRPGRQIFSWCGPGYDRLPTSSKRGAVNGCQPPSTSVAQQQRVSLIEKWIVDMKLPGTDGTRPDVHGGVAVPRGARRSAPEFLDGWLSRILLHTCLRTAAAAAAVLPFFRTTFRGDPVNKAPILVDKDYTVLRPKYFSQHFCKTK